jgi:hypothetical protein
MKAEFGICDEMRRSLDLAVCKRQTLICKGLQVATFRFGSSWSFQSIQV